MSEITIRHLHQVPELLPEVANWIFRAFWADKGHADPKFLEEKLKMAVDSDSIPLSLTAFYGSEPVGTINLIENDDEKRPYLKPWLAALWVSPEYRKKGIGSRLVEDLLVEARRLKVETLYLETHSPEFYEKLGARTMEEISPSFFLMQFEL